MPSENSATSPPAKRRHWYQFTLRTLIAGMIEASMVLGDVAGITARINEEITADQRQEVNRAIDTLKERDLGWVTVIESARGSLTQSQSDSPPSP